MTQSQFCFCSLLSTLHLIGLRGLNGDLGNFEPGPYVCIFSYVNVQMLKMFWNRSSCNGSNVILDGNFGCQVRPWKVLVFTLTDCYSQFSHDVSFPGECPLGGQKILSIGNILQGIYFAWKQFCFFQNAGQLLCYRMHEAMRQAWALLLLSSVRIRNPTKVIMDLCCKTYLINGSGPNTQVFAVSTSSMSSSSKQKYILLLIIVFLAIRHMCL